MWSENSSTTMQAAEIDANENRLDQGMPQLGVTYARLKFLVKNTLMLYANHVRKREYLAQEFRWVNERPIEYGYLFRQLTRIEGKTILDVGTGTTALPHVLRTCGYIVTAIDNFKDYWTSGIINRHWWVVNDNILNPQTDGPFDVVTCISVLEHITDHVQAVTNISRLLKPGGHLIVSIPYNENKYLSNVYSRPEASYGKDNPYICQVFSRRELERWVEGASVKIIDQEYWEVFSGEFWTFGRQLYPRRSVGSAETHHLTCIMFEKL